jgi:SAM-dependent methyltransferase
MSFKDYFSEQAAAYASYRPHYPPELFAWLAAISPHQQRVWDCATGSGQAAVALASHFAQVIATDASQAQLRQAQPHSHIHYVCASAEQVPLADTAVDLITVAQAAHWFDWPRFYQEVDRLLVADGVLAIWCYGLFHISPAIDACIQDYYQHTLGAYWPSERQHIDQAYARLPFPYTLLATPPFTMQLEWNLLQVMGYLATWSATRLLIKTTGEDPLPTLQSELAIHWGEPTQTRRVQWPLHLKAGHKP